MRLPFRALHGLDDAQFNFEALEQMFTPIGWTAPSLINSWANSGGALTTAGYLKDPLGFVHVKGTISGGASGTVAFVLPAKFRPGATCKFVSTSTYPNVCQLEVDSSGNVKVTWTTSSSFVGLDSIDFLAEN